MAFQYPISECPIRPTEHKRRTIQCRFSLSILRCQTLPIPLNGRGQEIRDAVLLSPLHPASRRAKPSSWCFPMLPPDCQVIDYHHRVSRKIGDAGSNGPRITSLLCGLFGSTRALNRGHSRGHGHVPKAVRVDCFRRSGSRQERASVAMPEAGLWATIPIEPGRAGGASTLHRGCVLFGRCPEKVEMSLF